MPDWLESLGTGSVVIMCQPGYGATTRVVRTVTRVTPTQLVIGSGRFRRSDGFQIASGWHHAWLEEATPERIEKARAEERRRANYDLVRHQSWQALDDATLEQIAALLRAAQLGTPRRAAPPEGGGA